jgi:hypothetical protein
MKAFALVFLLVGCANTPPLTRAELTWQALHAADSLQTVQIARSDCFRESNAVTGRLIGDHPSTAGAIGWGVGMAVAHYGVTRWLESIDAPRWMLGTWQAMTIVDTADAVKQNHDQGIGLIDTSCN